jgi:hypothetical protein
MNDGYRVRLRLGVVPLAVVAILLLATCQQPSVLEAELPTDGPPVATSQAAATRFVEKVSNAAERAAATKRLELTVTEEEVTSFLNIGSQLAERLRALQVDNLQDLQQLQGSPEVQQIEGLDQWLALLRGREGLSDVRLPDLRLARIREPQVYFRGNGQLIAQGYAQVLILRLPLRIVLAPRAADGELVLDFVEGKLGPVPVPELLFDQIGTGLAKLILAGQDYVEVTRIKVGDGTLTVSGRYLQ